MSSTYALMAAMMLLQALIFLTSAVVVCCSGQSQSPCACNTTTVWNALAALHRSTNGATWLRQDMWLQPGSTVCEWHGVVSCSHLSLSNNNLTGTLPSELSLLQELVYLDVSNNGITGVLPQELCVLSNIETFYVGSNNLTGTLPVAYANWTALQYFSVHEDNLSNTLPSEYKFWASIRHFRTSRNQLTGTLPVSFRNWTSIEHFTVFENNLSGTLPAAYAAWTSMIHFLVSRNNLTGVLPRAYAAWGQLEDFYVHSNSLEGTLPIEYASWSKLKYFTVSRNGFSGALPREYAAWNRLEDFSAHTNQLSSTLPETYAAWRMITWFEAYHNRQIYGSLPPAYSNWTSIKQFLVSNNNLSGTLPPEYRTWVSVVMLGLSSNSLRGSIPPGYGMLRPQIFTLDNNQLSGTLPVLHVGSALTLHNNPRLVGPLPPGMGRTFAVVLCNTSLCGALPQQWSSPFTKVVCVEWTAATPFTELFSAPPYELPACRSTTRPSSSPLNATTHYVFSPLTREFSTKIVTTAAVVAAGTGGAVTAMHLALRAAAIATRVTNCRSDGNVGGADDVVVGALVADNPTRLSIPGRLPLTTGTVLGNVLLVAAVPLLVAAGGSLAQRMSIGSSTPIVVLGWVAEALLLVWGVVQVPTAAASVALLLDAARAPTASGVCVCCVGIAVCAAAVVLTLSCWLRVRQCSGQGFQRTSSITNIADLWRKCFSRRSSLVAVRNLFVGRRCSWLLPAAAQHFTTRTTDYERAAQTLKTLHMAVVHKLLHACQFPHSWVIIYDAVGSVLAGVLVGIATVPDAPCSSLQAAAWAMLAVACVQATVAVVLLPRATVADCVFDCVMCTWTAVGLLLAALGIEDGGEEIALSQSAVALIWSVPVGALRVWHARDSLRSARHIEVRQWPRKERDFRGLARSSSCKRSAPPILQLSPAMSQSEALRHMILCICRGS